MKENYSLIYLTILPKKMIWLSTVKTIQLKCLKKTLFKPSLFMIIPTLSDSNSKIKKPINKKFLLSNLRINKTVSLNTPDGKSLNPMTLLTTLLKMPQLLKLNLNSSLIDPLKEINLLKDSQV
jgi:hypothetical protein